MDTRQIIQHLRSTTLGVKPNVAEIEEGEISVNLAKGGETLMIKNTENEIVEFKSKEYVDNLVGEKQDTILDLETIRTNAAKGATALQSIPAEYVTETELQNKGFLTAVPSEYITATELQNKGYLTSVPSEYVTESELQGKGYLTQHQSISHLATKAELSGYTTDSEFAALSNTVSQKANTSALSGYSTTGHNHDDRYYTESEIDTKVNDIDGKIGNTEKPLSDRITTVENYTVPDARNKVLWIGTSIPAGDIQHGNNGGTQSTTTNLGSNNYPKMIADALGFTLYNNARGSSFVCFYPSNEDGTANWAGKDWSEYSSEVWKGYSLSASFAQVDEKFGPNGLNCPQWLINNFKSYSYESLIIPYIDGTIASCDTVVIDHGYNDRSVIINEASWHPGDGETQFTVGSGRQWLEDLCDPLDSSMVSESYFQGKWWNDESVSSKKHYMSAMIFLAKKIWAVNPKIKIIIGNYFATKSNVFGAEFGNDRLGEFVCLANTAIASWLRVNCVEIWKHTGIYNRNLPAGNDYQLFCPDGVHPHSDSTGHSNKIIAGVYINAIRGTLYI
jgi:hypothetical protein